MRASTDEAVATNGTEPGDGSGTSDSGDVTGDSKRGIGTEVSPDSESVPDVTSSTASPSADPIQVCLLAPSGTLSAWASAAVDRMLAETAAEITLVVEDTSTDDRSLSEAAKRVVELREWGVVAAVGEVLGDHLDPLERQPIGELDGLDDAEWIRADPVPVDGWKNRIPSPAVERMAETDVAVRFGFGFLVGDALTAPEMGVLSFHHGNLREYRGQPMGFWEFVHDRETAGVTLQRINETLDGGEIVTERRVDIADAPTWGTVRERLFAASEDVLAEGVRNLADDDFEPETVPEDELGDLYTLPRGGPVLKYVAKTTRHVALE